MIEYIFSLVGMISALVTAFLVIRQTNRVSSSIPSLDDFIYQDEKGEWMIDERLGKGLDVIGSRMALSMRQSFFQGVGVQQKIQKGLQNAVVSDVVDTKLGPIGALGGLFGVNVKEYLAQNPGAIQYLMPLVSSFMSGIQGNNSPGSTGHFESPFK